MADLLYHIKNFFTLIDGDGNTLDISEPINWNKININVEFKNATNTYAVEFTDKDIALEFDVAAGRDFIQNVYDNFSVDGILLLQFGQINSDTTREVLYQGQANFSSFIRSSLNGVPTVSFNIERQSLGDNFQNRYSVKTNLNLAKTLSGVAIDPIQQVNVRLHPKLLTEHVSYKWDKNDHVSFPFFPHDLLYPTDDDGSGEYFKTLAMPLIFNGDSNIENLQEPIEPDGQLIYSGATLPPGISKRVLNFTWNFNGKFKSDFNTSGDLIYAGFKIYKKINISGGGTASISDGLIAEELGNEVQLFPDGSFFSMEFFMSGSGSITLVGDDAIFIRFYRRTAIAGLGSIFMDLYSVDNPMVLDVDETIYFAPTLAVGHNIFDAVNQQVGLITDKPNSLRSNYLTRGTGCMGNRIVLSGKMLRGFSDFDSGVVLSAQDWYQNINALTPIGMNIERDNDDNQFLRIEEISYYFRNMRLLQAPPIDLKSYKKSCDPSIIYNQIQAGDSKTPKSGQTNTLGDWIGQFIYSTPILRIANALNLMTNFILDSFYIELARRQQKSFDPTVTYETDQDNFLLHDNNILIHDAAPDHVTFDATNKKITFAAIGTYITLNDRLTISGTVSNNGVFTVINFEDDPFLGTIIFVQEPLVNETVASVVTMAISPRYGCKKNEDFDSVVGIFSPETAYNLIHHVMRRVIAWAKVWRSGMSQKPDNSKIVYTGQANNSNLATQLKDSIVCRFGDNAPSDVKTVFDGSNPLAFQYLDAPLFTENIIEFNCQLTWEVIKLIRMAFEGRHPSNLNYGYIEIINPDGVVESGWILSMKFQPVTLTTTFQLRERYA